MESQKRTRPAAYCSKCGAANGNLNIIVSAKCGRGNIPDTIETIEGLGRKWHAEYLRNGGIDLRHLKG
jgi:hypothetical protein